MTNRSFYVPQLESPDFEVAGRCECYSDFRSRLIHKLTGRYDMTDWLALRGALQTGFGAPTLTESCYSATNDFPPAAFVRLPADSTAAKLIRFANPKYAKSPN